MTATAAQVTERIRVRAREHRGDVPTVTVVISCFNYARYLRQAVQSAVSQDGVAVDVIIVDDASTDDSLHVARKLSSYYEAVQVLAHTTNQGVVETFNDGAKAARGEFLVRLDADDLLTPGSLRRSVAVARAYPSVGLVYGHPLHFSGDEVPSSRSKAVSWTIWAGRSWLLDRCRSGINVITSPEALVRRSILEEIGYQAPLKHTHDMELWFRIAAFADVAYIHGADQAWHREHNGSLSAREVDVLVDLQERRDAFDVLFSGPAGGISEAPILRQAATRALVGEALSTARHERDRGSRDSRLHSSCLDLAIQLDPGVARGPLWRTLTKTNRSNSAQWLRPMGLARRVGGRLTSQVRWNRWHRNGVY
jgi:hypothetical protein